MFHASVNFVAQGLVVLICGLLWMLLAGFTLLTLAWIFGNPPGSSPDEAAHYVTPHRAQIELTNARDSPNRPEA